MQGTSDVTIVGAASVTASSDYDLSVGGSADISATGILTIGGETTIINNGTLAVARETDSTISKIATDPAFWAYVAALTSFLTTFSSDTPPAFTASKAAAATAAALKPASLRSLVQLRELKGARMSYDLQLTGGDITFGSDGNPMIVQNTDKLAQDVSKIVLTPLGSDPGNVQYGTKLRGILGKSMDFSTIQGIIANTVSQALAFLQSLQAAQTTVQAMTYPELIDHVDAIAVIPTSDSGVEVQNRES